MVTAAAVMFGVFQDDTSKFIGTWEMEPQEVGQNVSQTYIFYENGTLLSIYIDYDSNETHVGWADYKVEGGKLCAKTHPHGAITDNESYCYDYEFSDGDTRMTLTTSELPTVTLIKVQ